MVCGIQKKKLENKTTIRKGEEKEAKMLKEKSENISSQLILIVRFAIYRKVFTLYPYIYRFKYI